MEEKTYSQMKQEFIDFFYNDVKKRLPEHNEIRREGLPRLITFYFTFLSFLMVFVLALLMPKACIYLVPVPFIGFGVLFYLMRNSTTNEIKHGFEGELKKELMSKFSQIFLTNSKWSKAFSNKAFGYGPNEQKEASNISKLIREQKILNPCPWIVFDDVISGDFNGAKINIIETDTRIFNAGTILLIPFLIVWLSFMTMGLFPIIAAIAAVVFSWKIFQYSVFRGVILEFDMPKHFKGHTFFHEKSFRSLKIPFDRKIYKNVKLESVSFENKYRVFSDDQIEARYLLTTAFIERIENLSFAFKAKYIRGSFKDNKLFLAIHTGKDMFSMGNDFKDSDTNTFEILYDEMISVLQVIDVLKLNEHTGL